MKANRAVLAAVVAAPAVSIPGNATDKNAVGSGNIKHVPLLSIEGVHAIDIYNCVHGVDGVNGGSPYCQNMAALSQTATNYVKTESSKPSDFFPGMAALASGGTPKTTGLYYDVAYGRSLDAPAKATGTGLTAARTEPPVLRLGNWRVRASREESERQASSPVPPIADRE